MSNTLTIRSNASLTKTLDVLGATTVPMADRYELTFGDDVNAIVPVEFEIAADGSQNIDLDVLNNIFGDDVDMATVRAILVYHDNASAASRVLISGGFVDQAFGGSGLSIPLGVGDHLSYSLAGDGVTVGYQYMSSSSMASTSDGITIDNDDADNAATVKLIVFGVAEQSS